jgi:tape measure domain-containing protein
MPDVALLIKGRNLSKAALEQLRRDIDKTTKAIEGAEVSVKDLGDKTKKTERDLTGLTMASAAVAAGLGLMVKSIISAAVQLEKQRKGLIAVAGGAAEAEKQLRDLREVAKLPGLGLSEAIQGSIALQAVNMSAEMAQRSLMAFGNALATVGKGRHELGGVILALTQMSAKGKIAGDDLRQIANYLPQIRKAMLLAFGTASSEEITKMGVTAEQFIERIVVEFEKLPRVAGGAANAIENLRDSMTQLRASLGAALLPTFSKLLNTTASLIERMNQLSESQKSLISWSTALGAGLASATTIALGLAIAIPKITLAMTTLKVAFAAVIASPVTPWMAGLAGAIGMVAAAIELYRRARKDVFTEQEMAAIAKNIEGAQKAVDHWAKQIKGLNQFLDEARKRHVDLSSEYPEMTERLHKYERAYADAIITLREAKGDTIGAAVATRDLRRGILSVTDIIGEYESGLRNASKETDDIRDSLKKAKLEFLALKATPNIPELFAKGMAKLHKQMRDAVPLMRESYDAAAEAAKDSVNAQRKAIAGLIRPEEIQEYIDLMGSPYKAAAEAAGESADGQKRSLGEIIKTQGETMEAIRTEYHKLTTDEKDLLDEQWEKRQAQLAEMGITEESAAEAVAHARYNHYKEYDDKIAALEIELAEDRERRSQELELRDLERIRKRVKAAGEAERSEAEKTAEAIEQISDKQDEKQAKAILALVQVSLKMSAKRAEKEEEAAKEMARFWENAIRPISRFTHDTERAISDMFASWMDEAKSFQDVWDTFCEHLKDSITQAIADVMTSTIVQSFKKLVEYSISKSKEAPKGAGIGSSVASGVAAGGASAIGGKLLAGASLASLGTVAGGVAAAAIGGYVLYEVGKGIFGMFGEGGVIQGKLQGMRQLAANYQMLEPMALQDGGIARRPTLAMIGEGPEEEAVIPLKHGKVPIDLRSSARSVIIENVNLTTVFPNARLEDMDQSTVNRWFRHRVIPAMRDSITRGELNKVVMQ